MLTPKISSYCEIELLGLLLVGPSLGDAGLAHERFRDSGFHRLHRVAVLKAVRDIKVFYGDYILDCLERGFHGLLHLPSERESIS